MDEHDKSDKTDSHWYDIQMEMNESWMDTQAFNHDTDKCCCITADGHLECFGWSSIDEDKPCANPCCWRDIDEDVTIVTMLCNPTCGWTRGIIMHQFLQFLRMVYHSILCCWLYPQACSRALVAFDIKEILWICFCIPVRGLCEIIVSTCKLLSGAFVSGFCFWACLCHGLCLQTACILYSVQDCCVDDNRVL